MAEGRVCLITGASRGIGRATALALHAAGWRLALAARGEEALAALAADIGGADHLVIPCDVTREAEVAAAVAEAVRRFGGLDALVCAAGVGSFAPTVDSTTADWDAQIGANLTGTYLACREALKVMLPRRAGHLVTILSVASTVAFPASAAYCASKWGAYGLTKVLAEEVRREGVRVTAVLPGSTDTPFWDAISGGPPREDMLPAARVADAVVYALEAPPDVSVDEIAVMPPKGIL
uniref:Ketoreductase domain-containing protein n=1 Tax=uncultured Armatimonadetes bacterium TaxID=157466 RepID=A0A6J4JE07_9BACT|nr:hypothetical protein AVDCRST_MAG63-3351 [uncultured Armatimonadetes bacterium]